MMYPVITASLLTMTVIGSYLMMALWAPEAYIYATYENLYGEWLQVMLFFSAAVTCGIICLRRLPVQRAFYAVLGLACFYVVGEEISWGQQVLGWSSPEWFEKNNLQGETNIHNLLTGPYGTDLKHAIEMVLAAALVGYGLIYPLLIRLKIPFFTKIEQRWIPAAPLYLWPCWCIAAWLELTPFRFNEAEIAELLVAMALALQTLEALHRGNGKTTDIELSRLARRQWAVCLVALLASVLVTESMLAGEESRQRIERRVDSGIEKFAGRYSRYGSHSIAADLYARAVAADPKNPSLVRSYARSLQASGRVEKSERILWNLIKFDLARLEKSPGSASIHRSLVRSYRRLQEHEIAGDHLQEALGIAQERTRLYPKSGNAHYALGRALELAGEVSSALEAYQRALRLKPSKHSWRKSVLRMRKAISNR